MTVKMYLRMFHNNKTEAGWDRPHQTPDGDLTMTANRRRRILEVEQCEQKFLSSSATLEPTVNYVPAAVSHLEVPQPRLVATNIIFDDALLPGPWATTSHPGRRAAACGRAISTVPVILIPLPGAVGF